MLMSTADEVTKQAESDEGSGAPLGVWQLQMWEVLGTVLCFPYRFDR